MASGTHLGIALADKGDLVDLELLVLPLPSALDPPTEQTRRAADG